MNRSLIVEIGGETTGLDRAVASSLRNLDVLAQGAIRTGNQLGAGIERGVNKSVVQLQRMGAAFSANARQSQNFGVLAGQSGGQVASSFDKAQAALVKLQSQIQNTTFRGLVVPPEIRAQYEGLARRINASRASTNLPAPSVGAFTVVNQRLSETKARMQDILAEGGRIPASLVAEFRGLERQTANVNQQFSLTRPLVERISDTGSRIASFGRTMSIVSAGIALIGYQSFKTYAEIESLQRGLTAVMHSAEGAKQEFANLRVVSALPGLGLQEAVAGSVRLQAVGFSAKNARDALLQFGNAVALTGGGKAQLNQITVQLGQLAAKGKVLSQDLRPVIEAAPAAATAIKNLFGTIDPEVISNKLAAAGKDSMYFISLLTEELAKLPRVTGGPKNALENLGDSVQIAQFNFVAAADKALGLTEKIDALGNAVLAVANGFATMSSPAQVAILGVVGLAAAFGPLALGIGTVMQLAPTFVNGMTKMRVALALLVSPLSVIVLATTAIVGLTYALVQFNERASFTINRARLLATVNNEVAASIAAETTTLNGLLAVARDETISKKAREDAIRKINALSPEYLGNLRLETINTNEATTALNKYVNMLTLKARIETLTKKAADSRVAADEAGAKPASEYTDNIPDKVGAYLDYAFSDGASNNLEVKGLERQRAAIVKNTSAAKFYEAQLKEALTEASKLGIQTGPTIASAPKIDFKNMAQEENAIQDLKDHYKDLERQVGNYVSKQLPVPAVLAAAFKKSGEELKKAKETMKATGGMGTSAKKEKSDLDVWKSVEDQLVADIQKSGAKTTQAQKDRLQSTRDYIKKLADLTDPDKIKFSNDGSKLLESKYSKWSTESLKIKAVVNFVSDGGLERYVKFANALDKRKIEILEWGSLKHYETQIEKIKAQIIDFDLKKMEIPKETLDKLDEYTRKVRQAKQAAEKTEEAQNKSDDLEQTLDRIPNIFGSVKSGLAKLAASDPFNEKGLIDKATQLADNFENAMKGVKKAIVEGTMDALAGLGEALILGGTTTDAGKEALENTLKSVIGMLADQAIAMGKALLLVGIPLIFSGVGTAEGLRNVAAGTALIVAGGAAKGLAAGVKLAKGGSITGETSAIIGEGRGTTRNNPEWVSPVDVGANLIAKQLVRLRAVGQAERDMASIGRQPAYGASGNKPVEVHISGGFNLKGETLQLVLDRYNKNRGLG